jgi:DNA polymerase III delta subunit
MPRVHLLTASGALQRSLLASTLKELASRGYEDVRREDGSDWASLLTENRSAGLFDDRSVVVVEEAERMGVMPAPLASMLEPDSAAVHILLVSGKPEPQAIIPKEFLSLCAVSKASAPSPWSKERDDIILSAARKHSVAVSRAVVSLLKELYDDVAELGSEAEKLAVICGLNGRREVSVPDVETYCMSDGSRGLLKLLDGICQGKRVESLASLGEILGGLGGGELLPLVSALHNRARAAYYFAAYPGEASAFIRALGVRDYAARLAESASRIYGREKLLEFTMGLIRINSNEKSGLGASWRDLCILIIDLMSGAGKDGQRQ